MDHIMKGLLSANVVEVQYFRIGYFLTRGLFTLNKKFIEDNNFDSGLIDNDSFFSAYDVLRKKVIKLDSQDQILSTNVFNPNNLNPMELYSRDFVSDKKTAEEAIKEFKKNRVVPICGRGDPLNLSLKSKVVLVDLFMATGNSIKTEDKAREYLEDIYFADPTLRTMTQLRYGFFFAMDYDWKSDQEALAFAAKKWLSLVDVYKELYLQVADDRSTENINSIKYPSIKDFHSYEQIIDYWPYALSPRPAELLDSDFIAIYESNEETSSDIA